MEVLSQAGQFMLYAITVLAVLSLMICIGKFFYKSPFKELYDLIVEPDSNDEQVGMIIFYLCMVLVAVSWFGVLTGLTFLTFIGLIGGTMCYVIGTIFFTVVVFIEIIVPYMKELHQRIIDKHERNK